MLKASQKRTKRAALREALLSSTGQVFGLVGYDTYRLSVEAGETDDDVLGVIALDFEELAIVDDGTNYLIHVIRTVGAIGDNLVERVFETVDGVVAGNEGSLFEVVLRDIADELANNSQCLFAVFGSKVSYTRFNRVNFGTTEGLLCYILARYGFHYLRAGEEHVGDTFGHDREVGQGRRIYGTTGAGTEDSRNLGNHTRSHDVTLENLGITGQGVDTLLDTGTTRVVEADTGRTHLHGHIHDLADFQGHRLGQRTAEYGKVLSEYINKAAFDRTVTGYDAVAQKRFLLLTEVGTSVSHKHIQLFEAAFVEELRNTLTSRIFTFLVLFIDGFLSTTQASLSAQLNQLLYFFKSIAHISYLLPGMQSSVNTLQVDFG